MSTSSLVSAFFDDLCLVYRMDSNSACRVQIRVPAYVSKMDDGYEDYHVTTELNWVLDKNTICFIDLLSDLDAALKHGSKQEMAVTFLDKRCNRYAEIASDSALLDAFDQYWEGRKLPLTVTVSEDVDTQVGTIVCSVEEQSQVVNPSQSKELAKATTPSDQPQPSEPPAKALASFDKLEPPADPWGEFDEIEYVGVSDEKENYKDLVSDDEVDDPDYIPSSEEDDDNDLTVNDEKGCDPLTHVTDVENPKIEVGVTFEDGHCFKRCIRQYAVLNEVELAARHCNSTRYRAYCKAKRCRWRIHASRMQDGRTWKVCVYILPQYVYTILLCV